MKYHAAPPHSPALAPEERRSAYGCFDPGRSWNRSKGGLRRRPVAPAPSGAVVVARRRFEKFFWVVVKDWGVDRG